MTRRVHLSGPVSSRSPFRSSLRLGCRLKFAPPVFPRAPAVRQSRPRTPEPLLSRFSALPSRLRSCSSAPVSSVWHYGGARNRLNRPSTLYLTTTPQPVTPVVRSLFFPRDFSPFRPTL